MSGSSNGVPADDELEPIAVGPDTVPDGPTVPGRWRTIAVPAGLALVVAVAIGFALLRPGESTVDTACNEGDLFDAANANAIVALEGVSDAELTGVAGALANRSFAVEDVLIRRGADDAASRVAHVRFAPGAGEDDLAVYLENARLVDAVRVATAGPCPLRDQNDP